jgi:hypothetical protein
MEKKMFNAFPIELNHEVSMVLSHISKKTYNNINVGESESYCTYNLLNGESVSFPYRIYYLDEYDSLASAMTFEQKMIYHCIFSRSCDGFVREKHIKEILKSNYPDWVMPYILKVSDEYVVQILESIYSEMILSDNRRIKEFCLINLQSFLYSHDRMISYWNEFYRNDFYYYKNYIGKKLFSDCFGYTRSMEKERKLKSKADRNVESIL